MEEPLDMTKFYFFDRNDGFLYTRSDAIEFVHYTKDFSFKGAFPPHPAYTLETGMRVGWQDDDKVWQVHEITKVGRDAFGGQVDLEGVHIALAELRDFVIEEYEVKKTAVDTVVAAILTGTGWHKGTLTGGYSSVPVNTYTLTHATYLYSQPKERSKYRVSDVKYAKGTKMYAVDDTSLSSMYKVEAPDGRTGWADSDDMQYTGQETGSKSATYGIITIDETQWTTAWELLETAMEKAELLLSPRVTINEETGEWGRYIDMLSTTPTFRGVRLTCDTNIQEGSIEYDAGGLYTALYGLGKNDLDFGSVVWTVAGGYPADKPAGQKYIVDPEALARYGRSGQNRFGVIYFDDEDDKDVLLRKTWEKLQIVNEPAITISGTIADLYEMGYGGESMRLYDAVHVVLQPIDTKVEARVIDLEKDLVQPENTKPTIGTSIGVDIISTLMSTYRR